MWLENVERASLITAHEVYGRIAYICAAFDTIPVRLARMKNRDATSFALRVVIHFEQKAGFGTKATNSRSKAIYGL